ncbi:MAG TPA: LssY C-terminal domain-containing protein [Bryobacteraceae bacterium]|nr:LssY C-terminal domain-containing protein [Bryobacteraceae bacterium]
MRVICSLLTAVCLGLAAEVPAGTDIHIRITSKVATSSSQEKDPVEAVVITPVVVGERLVVPSGARLKGQVSAVKPPSRADERGILTLNFTQLIGASGKAVRLKSKLVDVDNARESVDERGQVIGILASETLSSRMDQGINKVSQRNRSLGELLEVAKGAILKQSDGQIAFEPGVEMTVRLQEPLQWDEPFAKSSLAPVSDEAGLYRMVNAQPFQTVAQNPPKPSDLTNVMYIGTQDQLEAAFKAAGWDTAAALNKQSALETFRAIAELRGYKEAPVSILLLDGRQPDLVFQKQNNTFAQRHHLRIWRRPADYQGKPVWVCSATHDIGIAFSDENHTFIHKIDPDIDKERAKVVSDLLFTNLVKSLALVDRPEVPQHSQNATGDNLDTDGKMAVLFLK